MATSQLKALDHVPVTSLVALTQTALGFGAGLLVAGKLGRTAKNATAVAMFSVGVISTLPLLVDVVTKVLNRPGSERDMRKRLASIRRDSGVSQDVQVF